jgi:hypothetical protein
MKTDFEIQKNAMEGFKYSPFPSSIESAIAIKDDIITHEGTFDTT